MRILVGSESVVVNGMIDATFGSESDLLVEPHRTDRRHVDARDRLEEDRLNAPESMRRAHQAVHECAQLCRDVFGGRTIKRALLLDVDLLKY